MESFRVRGATVALLTVVAVMLAAVSPVLQAGALAPLPASTAPTSNYGYTGGGQTYTVPSDVCYLDIVAIGGGGGSEEDGQGSGGSGARVTVNQVKVLPGTNISVQVGSGGARLNDSSGGGGYTGGFGRTGGNGAGAGIHDDSGAGGAATGVFWSGVYYLIAGGGGGAGGRNNGGATDNYGGTASGLNGGNGGNGNSSAGIGGSGSSSVFVSTLGVGGNGPVASRDGLYPGAGGGGGGGGYNGGGAGGADNDNNWFSGQDDSGGGGGAGGSFYPPGSYLAPTGSTSIGSAGNGASNGNGGNGSVSITPSGGCEADLTTTKTVDYPKRTRDGGGNTTGTATSTYTIKVSNVSPSTNNPTGTDPDGYTFNGAKNIVVVDTYPDGFTPTEYPSDCVVNSTARTITCTRTANLAAGANYAFDIKGTWDDKIAKNPDGAVKTNLVDVSHDRYDPVPANNASTASVAIYDLPEMGHMSVTKTLAAGTSGTLAGWTFVATSTNPKCTPVAIATTNASGVATFDPIIDKGIDSYDTNTPVAVDETPYCLYTITEVQQQGFVQTSPASGGSLNNVNPNPITSSVNNVGTFTNRGTTYGDLTVTKTVVGGGDPSGFYFVATNSPAVAGCTSSAVATSVGATATFSNLVDMLANGTACTYVVTEIPREGFSQTGSTVTATNPAVPAVNVGTITNTPVTTATGQFTITKTVNGSASVEGWVFIAEADIPGCTDSAVATTDVSGIARFEVMTETAGGTPCTYTVTEIPQTGYVQTTPTGTITGTPTDTVPYPNTDVVNSAATTGTIAVTKSVVDENGDAVPTANINADWTFVLSTTTADSACTQGPVYAVTDSNGDASFDVVAMTPTGTTCQYAIVEIAQPGYTQTQPSPDLTDAEAGDTVAFVNQELLEMGSFKVEKEVYNSSGVIDTGLRGGWTFIASGNEPGCTPTAVATTDSTGIALFDVIKTSPSGTACTYTVTEAVQAGYTVSGVPATGDPHSAAIPKITNRADATATYGSIVVDKAVETADGTLLTDPSDLEGWAITASSGQSGCTTTAVTLTDTTGIATFDGLVMETADGTICEYTISEQVPDGYDVTVDPTTPVLPEDPAPAAPQATVTNAEIQTIGEFSIQKTVQGGDGDPSNWVFVAASSQEGCTQTAVATTDGSGLATFTVVDTSATGDACAYEVTEILKDGYVNTVAPPTAADPDAVGSGPTYDVTNVGTTTGTITVDKTVVVNGSQLANGDPLNGGWIFTLVNDPAVAGCTAGPVYAITDANGDATFPDVVDTPAGSNTACEYTVTEVEQVGYEVDANPATGVAVGGDAPFQNTQNQTLGSLSVSKSVTDGLNQPAPAERAGWTFVVSSTQEGCTASATAVTDSNGDATFPNLIDVNANGETCVYDVDEVAIPGYTVSGDVPTTGQEADGTDLVVMNTADPIATESSVIVYKNVDPSADPTTGDLLEGGTDSDALLGNWVFTLTGTAPCTTGPVYAITDNNGVAVFSDLIDMPPGSTTPCEYTVTEVTQAGYAVTPSASQDTVTGATPVVFTNTENQTLSGFDIQKIVLDPAGDPVADASGWTFIATSTMAGCSNPAVAVTGTDGLAHFENIVDINADGDQCEYSVTEAPQAGYSTTDALPLTVNPDAVNNQTVFEDQVTNKADTVSTYGDIVITKSVYDSAGTELTSAEDRSGWIMHAANSPVVDGCTTSATAVTDSNGVAWFTGLVKTTADGDDCTYVITEAPEPGYTVAGSPTAAIAPVDPLTTATRAATPDITNTEKIAYGSITAHKDLYDEHGDPVTAPDLAGWTFVAISETPGCTSTAVQTTDGDGNVTFTDLIATNTDGVPCTYTIDETRGPGYTVTDAPLTAIQPTSPTPADAGTITNTLTPKATTGDITVDKTVIDSDNQTVTDGDARKGGWLFVLTGTVDGCTTGPVYALTDTNGDATFTGVIDIPAGSDTPCEYTITEVEQAGYDLTNSPAGTISVDGTAAFENSQNQTLDSLTVQKTVVDGLGNTITSGDAVSGWTFVASSDQDGCTTSQLAITGTDGTATFPNLIDTNADGDTCVYDIDEVELPGYTISGDVPATDHEADGSTLAVKNTADPIATESSVIVHKNVSLSDGTNLLGATDNDDLLGNWVFTLTAADGQPTDCTQGPVYAITNNDGIAVFTNLIENTPSGHACQYTVTEVTEPGFAADPVAQDTPTGETVTVTNTEN